MSTLNFQNCNISAIYKRTYNMYTFGCSVLWTFYYLQQKFAWTGRHCCRICFYKIPLFSVAIPQWKYITVGVAGAAFFFNVGFQSFWSLWPLLFSSDTPPWYHPPPHTYFCTQEIFFPFLSVLKRCVSVSFSAPQTFMALQMHQNNEYWNNNWFNYFFYTFIFYLFNRLL